MTLTEFLLERIAEDEALAEQIEANPERPQGPEYVPGAGRVAVVGRSYLLAECEAKRRIVGQWREVGYTGEGGAIIGGEGPETHHEVLRFLAMPYADHPDFNPDWKP